MKKSKKYLEKPEVRERLAILIKATDYARCPPYECLNCLPYCGQTRAAWHEEYRGVVNALDSLGVTRQEVNQELENRHWQKIFSEESRNIEGFYECLSPDDLCNITAEILDKKNLLFQTQVAQAKQVQTGQKKAWGKTK